MRDSDSELKSLQVCLPVYMAGCLKRMKVASLMHEAQLRELGHPGLFPSKPVATCKDWDILQECDIDTLRFCKVIRGDDARFSSFVREVTDDAQNYIQVGDAIGDARHVLWLEPRAPPVRVVLMPTQHGVRAFKKSAAEEPGADALKWSGANARLYYDLFLRASYAVDSKCSPCLKGGMHDDLVASMTLEGSLTLFESWHVLELLPSKWTSEHRYKCNCSEFFKRGSCSHVLMLGMLSDKAIKIPA